MDVIPVEPAEAMRAFVAQSRGRVNDKEWIQVRGRTMLVGGNGTTERWKSNDG